MELAYLPAFILLVLVVTLFRFFDLQVARPNNAWHTDLGGQWVLWLFSKIHRDGY